MLLRLKLYSSHCSRFKLHLKYKITELNCTMWQTNFSTISRKQKCQIRKKLCQTLNWSSVQMTAWWPPDMSAVLALVSCWTSRQPGSGCSVRSTMHIDKIDGQWRNWSCFTAQQHMIHYKQTAAVVTADNQCTALYTMQLRLISATTLSPFPTGQWSIVLRVCVYLYVCLTVLGLHQVSYLASGCGRNLWPHFHI